MERMVNRRLMQFLEDGKYLDNRQFAFRQGFGTSGYLGSLSETIWRAVDSGHHIDIGILDIAKAYNSVWREGVLRQLLDWGVKGRLGVFLQDYLANRKFRVGIGGCQSDEFVEVNGVPQGSALAVTLFLVSVNSMFQCLPRDVYAFMYADDIVIVVSGRRVRPVRRKIQTAVNAIGRWAESVGFSIAAEKCSITHCCNTHHVATGVPVKLGSVNIPFRREPKILGVTIDRKFCFIPHFRRIKQECESRLRLLRTISSRHPRWNRLTGLNISRALINSRIFYGVEATCTNRSGLTSVLAPLYNRSVRLCSNLLPGTPATDACVEAGVLPFRWIVAVTIIKRALSYLEKTTGNDCVLLQVSKEIHRSFTGTDLPKLARLHRVCKRPWFESGLSIDTSLASSRGANPNSSVATAKFAELVNTRFTHHMQVFTDGSKCNNSVGIGISGIGRGLCLKMPKLCSVFSAEAAAIAHAVGRVPANTPVVIFTDSLSVLSALEAGESRHPFIQAIEVNCAAMTTLCWVLGHSNIHGNERADTLAAVGRSAQAFATDTVPAADIFKNFKNETIIHFTRHWRSSTGLLSKVKGDLNRWNDRDDRREQRVLSRLRARHTRVTHAHTITRCDPPICTTCNTRLTVEHMLINCAEYHDLREHYQLSTSIRDVLSNDPVREEVLLSFLKDAGLFWEI
ncbi:uncharacterized protein LOC129773263 [Toxorhynchites rutilus septentrionalis]|uniref:uncharacterized protein LOC129773263 n=1 Tax=Toxorhynchites rutilus septentrionalis TaxID=329112 RepID=UPI0024785F0A|nr:uncharacterized protein LOC129773263 [Toxorhynchites rutilus septentrionalis]